MVCFIPITFCNSSWNFYHKEIIFDFVFFSLLYHIWRFLTILFHKIFICVLRFWPPKFGLFHFWRYSNILLLLDYPLGIAKIWARNIFQKAFTFWENYKSNIRLTRYGGCSYLNIRNFLGNLMIKTVLLRMLILMSRKPVLYWLFKINISLKWCKGSSKNHATGKSAKNYAPLASGGDRASPL